MKLTNTQNMKASKSGMTLLELTVVILVLLSLISILFIGARAWKKGSDRAASILQIRNVQQAVRSFANMNGKNAGDTVAGDPGPPVILSLRAEIFGAGKFIENDPTLSSHPAGGTNAYAIAAPTVIPNVGTLYMTCNNAEYAPAAGTTSDW
jgi:prepilin-type N-terminal cleavage/methylation domain-containing protein